MTGPTRRRVLTGCGAGLAALAGCSGFPGLGGDDGGGRREYDSDAIERAVGDVDEVLPPDAFPVRLPAAFQDYHREQAREYLDDVPAEPSFPNEEIATRLADQRAEAMADLDREASGRPRTRLETWRRRRAEAATVRGTYLAATGDVESDDLENERGRVRALIASFQSDWAYRATDPVAAAVVHETVEEYVEASRRELDGRPAFSRDPGDDVFHVGEVVGDLDEAEALVVDAARMRQQYRHHAGDTEPYRQSLSVAASHLRYSLSRTTRDLEPYVESDLDVFDRDLEGTPAELLYRDATRVLDWRSEKAERARRRHAPATATVETGRGLVAAGALEAVVEAIQDGRFQDQPSVDDVGAASQRARDVLETAWEATPQPLAVELARPALLALKEAARDVNRGYADPKRALATLVLAEAQARAVPPATTFVERQLREAAAG